MNFLTKGIQTYFNRKMDENIKVEEVKVLLPNNANVPTCSISHLNNVKDEWICTNLNTEVKHENSGIQKLDHQIKFEAPDIKLEPLESEELQIKDEIDERPTNGTLEKFTQFEYFFCGLCNSKYIHKRTLKQHMKIHTGKEPFKCSTCDYRCIRKSSLSRHIKMHTGEKSFKCVECGFTCAQKDNLSRHIKTHTGEKLFKCDLCNYRCITSGSLSRHIKTHTADKPFKCSLCDYGCIQKSNLSRHIKSHTGEKPFKCELCDYTCVHKGGLNQHMKIHIKKTSPSAIDVCKRFKMCPQSSKVCRTLGCSHSAVFSYFKN